MIHEELYWNDSAWRGEYGMICGVDEAGRGPLFGPVVVAGVILPEDARFDYLTDSKKVTERRREQLYQQIIEQAVAYHVAFIDNETIDEINILNATLKGMSECILAMKQHGAKKAFVDGNRVPSEYMDDAVPVIKGDGKSASIAAASILAKVSRDRWVCEIAKEYPQYGLEQHKGYPTKAHYEAIAQYGLTPYHRRSFIHEVTK